MEFESDPDAGWVAELAGAPRSEVDRALRAAAGRRELYASIDRAHRRAGRPGYVEIDAPFELYAITRLIRPSRVVEVGVSSGVSSAYLLQGLHDNRRGMLYSVDRPSHPRPGAKQTNQASWSLPPGLDSGWAIPPALKDRWDLRLGDKAVRIPELVEELAGIDLFVYDVPHDDRDAFREFGELDRRFTPGSVAIADHGPGGGRCPSLQRWARRRGTVAVGRSGLGLYGFRAAQPERAEAVRPVRRALRPQS